jgi:hypothetical protein
MAIFIAMTAISLFVSFFRPNSNFYLHLFCLASGFVLNSSDFFLRKHIRRRVC